MPRCSTPDSRQCHCTLQVYSCEGDNPFVGKMRKGVLDFAAVDSDAEEIEVA